MIGLVLEDKLFQSGVVSQAGLCERLCVYYGEFFCDAAAPASSSRGLSAGPVKR